MHYAVFCAIYDEYSDFLRFFQLCFRISLAMTGIFFLHWLEKNLNSIKFKFLPRGNHR